MFHRSGGRAGLGRVADEGIKPDEVSRAGFEHHLRLRDAFSRADDTRLSVPNAVERRNRSTPSSSSGTRRRPNPSTRTDRVLVRGFVGWSAMTYVQAAAAFEFESPPGWSVSASHLEGGVARRGETDGVPSLMGFAHVHLREPGEKIAPAHPERAVVGAGVAQLGAEPRGPHLAPCAPLSVPLLASPRISYAKQSKRFAVPRRGSNHDRIPVPRPVPVPVSALRVKRGEFPRSADGGGAARALPSPSTRDRRRCPCRPTAWRIPSENASPRGEHLTTRRPPKSSRSRS